MNDNNQKWKMLPGAELIAEISETLKAAVLRLDYTMGHGFCDVVVETTNGIYIFDLDELQWAKFDPESETFKIIARSEDVG